MPLRNIRKFKKKCRNEVFTVLGSNPPTKEKIRELLYIANTLNEVLRLFAPIPLIKRFTEKNTVLAGYNVPKGTEIIISQPVLHRSPKHWENPEEFNPDRWDSNVSHAYWFLPFIDGPRNCIGKKFALVEATVILVGILQNFSFRISDAHPFIKRQVVSLRADPGLTFHVSKIFQ
jgi:cytochrome P450